MSRKQLPAVVLLLVVLLCLLNPASSLADSIVSAPGDGGDVPGQGDFGDITQELPRRYREYFLPVVAAGRVVSDENCTHYVDSEVAMDGDGSWDAPWDNIGEHVNDLEAGDMLCVRGAPSPPGRIYNGTGIVLDADTGTPNGTEDAPIVVRSYPSEYVVLRATGRKILDLHRVSHWHFEGLAFDREGRGGYAVDFRYADSNVFRNCEFYNGGEEGLHFGYGERNLIENCAIHDFKAGPYADAHGILMAGGKDNVIRDNEIYDCAGDGIHFYPYNPLSGTIVEGNHIYTTLGHCGENAVDIKAGSPIIRGNVLHGYRYCDGSCGGSSGGIGEAILIHMDATNVLVEGNEIYDSASGIVAKVRNVRIVNNVVHDLVVDPTTWLNSAIFVYRASGVSIVNNTFANLPSYALYIGEWNTLSVQNNLFYNTRQVHCGSTTQLITDYNGWFSASDRLEGVHDTVDRDPGFLSAGDYRLRDSSPAIDVGDNDAGAPTRDFDGKPRPYGPNVDLGAFEVQVTSAVSGLQVSEGVTTTPQYQTIR